MSLLDDVSIVVTPNGYKAGVLFSVIPSSGAADLEVTRGTAATRVDENGLVNYAEIVGSELAICGDFECASPLTGWTVNSDGDISIDSGRLKTLNVTNRCRSYRTYTGLTIGKTYEAFVGNTGGATGFCHITSGTANNNVTLNAPFFFVAGATTAQFQCGVNSTVVGSFTYFDNISLKENARDNVPRIDYTGGGCPHILAEPQSTNLFINSVWDGGTDNVSAPTGWTLSDLTDPVYTYSTSQYPSGKKINIQCTGSRLILSQTVTIPSSSLVNVSVKVKYISGSFAIDKIASTLSAPADNIQTYYYNGILVAPSFTPTEDGILEMRVSSVTGGTIGIRLGLGTGSASTGHIELDMPQCETLTYRTSFIPTTTSTVTRNQDIFTRDGIGSLINSTEGTFFAEISKPIDTVDAYQLISINNNASNSDRNSVTIGFMQNTSNLFIRVKSSGSNVVQSSNQVSNANTFYKVAVSYKSGASKIYVDGSSITPNSGNISDTFTFDAILDKLSFDYNGNNGLPFYGNVRQLQVYDTALTDEQLLQLTGESGTDFYESYAEMASALTYTIQ